MTKDGSRLQGKPGRRSYNKLQTMYPTQEISMDVAISDSYIGTGRHCHIRRMTLKTARKAFLTQQLVFRSGCGENLA